jgi:L-2-hydroxyglutarate oxidase LhgO
MSGIGFNKSKIKGSRWGKRRYKREMQKQEQEKLSHFMCFKYHEVGHLANGCPNEEKLKLKKEEERLKHVKCFKCRTWGHLTSMCLTKQLVKQQVEPQPKPQVEQETPQEQIKINHEDGGDLMVKKKKTRKGGKARERAMHLRMNQDVKQVSKNKEEKMKKIAHMRCYSCDTLGHLLWVVQTSLRRRLKQTRRSKAMRSIT